MKTALIKCEDLVGRTDEKGPPAFKVIPKNWMIRDFIARQRGIVLLIGFIASLATLLIIESGNGSMFLGIASACTAALILYFFARSVIGSRLVVASDGVAFLRWPYRTIFIPYSRLESLQPIETDQGPQPTHASEGFEITAGGIRCIAVKPAVNWFSVNPEDSGRKSIQLLRVAIERAKAAYDRATPVVAPQLERKNENTDDWLKRLDAIVGGVGAPYREETISREVIEEILENPAASDEQRFGAALALVSKPSNHVIQYISDVAATVASPSLKKALLDVTTGNLRAIRRACRRLQQT